VASLLRGGVAVPIRNQGDFGNGAADEEHIGGIADPRQPSGVVGVTAEDRSHCGGTHALLPCDCGGNSIRLDSGDDAAQHRADQALGSAVSIAQLPPSIRVQAEEGDRETRRLHVTARNASASAT
jgi:hypothetical protein